MWTRIWCVRPFPAYTRQAYSLEKRSNTRQCVTALRLFFSVTAIFLRSAGGGDRRIDGAGIVLDIAADDTHIRPGQTVILQLRGKRGVREVVLGCDDEAGCVFVDAVDDAGPLFPTDAGQRIAAVCQQCVDERAVCMTGAG